MESSISQLLYVVLGVPIVFSILAISNLFGKNLLHHLSRLSAVIVGAAVFRIMMIFNPGQPYQGTYLLLDALSLWMMIIVTLLYLAFAFTAEAYLDRDTNIRYGYLRRFSYLEGRFYALSHIFVWTMLLVVLVNNLGLMWVTIEATTLVSALLVAFKFTKTSLEAAWKYVMVCTVGICLALLGTILVYYAQLQAVGQDMPLDWVYLTAHAQELNPALAKIAFCFLFVGYGTKVGLAPMHAWLPDAHSESPALTSGLLSGSLCICAIYVLLRNIVILMPTVGAGFISGICVGFGLLTIGLAVPFVVVQRDIKRMLAYSSMENFGLMAVGLGIFLPTAVEAGLLHMLNHALVKYALFYTAGTIMETYATKNMMRIHGMLKQSPRTAIVWLLGIAGILGMPPIGVFFSKFHIIASLFSAGSMWRGILALMLLAGIVIGILYHAMRMLGGQPTRKSAGELMGFMDTAAVFTLLILSGAISATIHELPFLGPILQESVKIVMGGAL